jgi:hypothetical protein
MTSWAVVASLRLGDLAQPTQPSTQPTEPPGLDAQRDE